MIKQLIAVAAFTASTMMTSGAQAAPGDYCNYVDGAVYCGVEENIVEGDPGYRNCIQRWTVASWACPPDE
ncbi:MULTISPECIES: hypothetical protein [unclassified Brevundimonas]|uniref:hypothetical protein n=1 Tax=unclassified Brevundimonas TaxID=2622653 RepID=UPI0025BD67A1|nr:MULTISPECIES: hypothetical protein [unclassified Brevundimonas]